MSARRAACALLTASALLTAFACTTPEPASTPQPSARSLLPPTASPDASPSPSNAAVEGRAEAAEAADPAPATAPPTKPAAKPSPLATKKPALPGISGQVLAGGQPVTDGQVKISGSAYHHNTTTSSAGRFQSATPPGTYTITVTSPSASCAQKTVTVHEDAVSHVTITCSA